MVLVVLLKASELLSDQNATPVMKMMGWHILQRFTAGPHCPSIRFNLESSFGIEAAHEGKNQESPEGAVLLEKHLAVVVHRMCGTRSLEIDFVSRHVSLKLDSIFRGHSLRVLMVIVQEVVNGGLMEVSYGSKSSASNRTTTFRWKTTLVVAQIINVVFVTLLFKLLHTLCSITSRCVLS